VGYHHPDANGICGAQPRRGKITKFSTRKTFVERLCPRNRGRLLIMEEGMVALAALAQVRTGSLALPPAPSPALRARKVGLWLVEIKLWPFQAPQNLGRTLASAFCPPSILAAVCLIGDPDGAISQAR
jgi:hypothetical protein